MLLRTLRTTLTFVRACLTPAGILTFAFWLLAPPLVWVKRSYDVSIIEAFNNLAVVPVDVAALVPVWWANVFMAFAPSRPVGGALFTRFSRPSAWMLPSLRETMLRGVIVVALLVSITSFMVIGKQAGYWPAGVVSGAMALLTFSAAVCFGRTNRQTMRFREDLIVVLVTVALVVTGALWPSLSLRLALAQPLIFFAATVALSIKMLGSEFSKDVSRRRTSGVVESDLSKEDEPEEEIEWSEKFVVRQPDAYAGVIALSTSHGDPSRSWSTFDKLFWRVSYVVNLARQTSGGKTVSWLVLLLATGIVTAVVVGIRLYGSKYAMMTDTFGLSGIAAVATCMTPLLRPLPAVLSRSEQADLIFWSSVARTWLVLLMMITIVTIANVLVPLPPFTTRSGRLMFDSITPLLGAVLVAALVPLAYAARLSLIGRFGRAVTEYQRHVIELFMTFPVTWIVWPTLLMWPQIRGATADAVLWLIVAATAVSSHLLYRALLRWRYTRQDLSDTRSVRGAIAL